LPIDVAARAIVELQDSEFQYVNLVNPNPTAAPVIFETVASLISAKLVSYAEWVGALNKSSTDIPNLTKNPSLALLEFFQSRTGFADKAGVELFGAASLSSRHAVEGSEALRNSSQLNSKDAERWVGYWRKIGFLDN